MDEIDRRAVNIIIEFLTSGSKEMDKTIKELKRMAKEKKRTYKNYNSVREILDYWGNLAYEISFKSQKLS